LQNLVWQAQNEWATLQFIRNISTGMLADIPRYLFGLGQLLYMHPLSIPIWLAGLVFFFSPTVRPPANPQVIIAYDLPPAKLEPLCGELVVAGKTYHPLAPAYNNNLPIYVCRAPRVSLIQVWSDFKTLRSP
jgi:hypothetical protein